MDDKEIVQVENIEEVNEEALEMLSDNGGDDDE